MLTAPNIISLIRIPLAFVFFQQNLALRILAVLLALVSDGIDGFLARKFKQTSRLGTFLDPFTDRFFVVVAVAVLFTENQIATWKIVAMFSRDIAILIFGCYLLVRGRIGEYYLRAIWCGKISTVLQLIVLLSLLLNFTIPDFVFMSLIGLGFLAFMELMLSDPKHPQNHHHHLPCWDKSVDES